MPAVNTNKHNVASPWLWIGWATRFVFHLSLNLSYSTIRKKTFVLSRSCRLGYIECFMTCGCNYRRWFPRALQSKMLLSIRVLRLMVMLPWAFFFFFAILVNALLWTAPTRKVALNKYCFCHWMAGHANKVQAYLTQFHARYSLPSGKWRLGWRRGSWKNLL